MGKSSDEVGGVELHNSGGVTEMQCTFLKFCFLLYQLRILCVFAVCLPDAPYL